MNFQKYFCQLFLLIILVCFSSVIGRDMTPTSMGSCTSVTLIPGIEISFTGLGSHDNDNQSKSRTEQWEWNFDYDKNDPWNYDISTTSIDVEWVFNNDGPYNIAVKYYDNDGSDGNIYRFTVNIKSTRRTYYVKDHLGSIRMTIDENGEVVSAQDYHPYGEILRSINNSSVNEKYKFTEKERDTESNYDYFGARYLNSELGRWNSVDPLADKYPGMSPYNYTLGNPLLYIDPNGMDVYFYNSDSTSIVTIVTGTDDHQHIYTGLDYTTENPLVFDVASLLEETGLSSIDAIGISFTGDFAFGGGAGGGTEFVYFLSGKNQGELHQYFTGAVTLGLGIGGGISGLAASYGGKGSASAESWNGWTSSYSGSVGYSEGSYFWSNVEGKPDLWPGMYGRQKLWEGVGLGGVYSGKVKYGLMWKATKYNYMKKW